MIKLRKGLIFLLIILITLLPLCCKSKSTNKIVKVEDQSESNQVDINKNEDSSIKEPKFHYDPTNFAISDKDWVKSSINEYGKSEPPYGNYFIDNPYKYVWNTLPKFFLGRLYLDINDDKIPELLISSGGGTGGTSFITFLINKTGYTYLGDISFDTLKVLPNKHNDFNDILVFWRLGSTFIGDFGKLSIYEFNGKEYNVAKEINHDVSRIEADKYMIKYIHHSYCEEHPYDFHNEENNKLIWKPEDDDKYRISK